MVMEEEGNEEKVVVEEDCRTIKVGGAYQQCVCMVVVLMQEDDLSLKDFVAMRTHAQASSQAHHMLDTCSSDGSCGPLGLNQSWF